MGTRVLIELNLDHADKMNSQEFLDQLAAFIRNPGSRINTEIISSYGVIVHGTCHVDSRNTRGFHISTENGPRWSKVINGDKPMNEPPF
jgi:hypothetical protein